MKRFAQLYFELDSTNSTLGKIAALERYFRDAAPADAAWAVYFLSGNKPRQVVPSRKLYALAAELAGLPIWLMDECYEAVGDLAETVAHVLPIASQPDDLALVTWIEERLLPLAGAGDEERMQALAKAWRELDGYERLVWNKLITGEFRIGVAQRSVTRALANVSGIEQEVIAHRLSGVWRPSPASYLALISPLGEQGEESRPYPLFLAHALEPDPAATLGDIADWQLEWKYDGMRGELIRRGAGVYLWSRGDDLINDSFPELVAAGAALPAATVIDGEIVVWQEGKVAPFNALQQRLGRKAPAKSLLARSPAALIAYDLLEENGVDVRTQPLAARRERLEALLAALPDGSPIRLSPRIEARTWDEAARMRASSR
ncbi:MAG: ATP-dependent DNA ligase, partial [Burkholderiales bacterium]